MSTFIRGFKLSKEATVFQLQREVRSVLRPALLISNYQKLLNKAVTEFDGSQLTKTPATDFWNCFRAVIREETSNYKDKNSFCIENTSIVVFENVTQDERYAILFGNQSDLFEELGSIESEYGYWDATDSYPVGVTDTDWKKRKRVWEGLLNFREEASVQGLEIKVLSRYELEGISLRIISEYENHLVFPSPDSRLDKIAENLYVTEKLEDIDGSSVMEAVSKAMWDYHHLADKSEWIGKSRLYLADISWNSNPCALNA